MKRKEPTLIDWQVIKGYFGTYIQRTQRGRQELIDAARQAAYEALSKNGGPQAAHWHRKP